MSDAIAADPAPAGAARVVGYFRDETAFLAACRAGVAAGHAVDTITPYPVHGLDPILGLKRSFIGRPVLSVILFGCAAVLGALILNGTLVWPINVSGKPYDAWPLFVVCTLESGLLFGAIVNLLLAFHTCKLMPNPLSEAISARLTDDTFAVVLPASAAARDFLAAQGAVEVAEVQVKPGTAERGEAAHA